MKTRINVTANDIAKGEAHQPATCPVAIAIQRKLKPKAVALVGTDDVSIGCEGIELPMRAVNFILAFDDRSAVQPFRFTIDIPDKLLK